MGTYLSTPITDKHIESGSDLSDYGEGDGDTNNDSSNDVNNSDLPVSWAVVDMQGWRKSMEDAHVARTDVRVSVANSNSTNNSNPNGNNASGSNNNGGGAKTAKVFAVFDGHGGAEVARFCQQNLVEVLMQQEGWRMLAGDNNNVTTAAAAVANEASSTRNNENENTDDNTHRQEIMASHIGSALIHSFHALDRLIDNPKKWDEIERWRTERPPVYCHGAARAERYGAVTDEGLAGDGEGEVGQSVAEKAADATDENVDSPVKQAISKMQNLHLIGDLISQDEYDSDDSSTGEIKDEEAVDAIGGEGAVVVEDDTEKTDVDATLQGEIDAIESASTNQQEPEEKPPPEEETDTLDDAPNVINDDSDDEKESQEEGEEDKPRGMMVTDAYSLISKLLHINGSSEDGGGSTDAATSGDDGNDNANTAGENVNNEKEESNVVIPTQEQLMNPPCGIVAPSASVPTKILNGRKVCNLPDHPIHAGCTSVVAVIIDNTLVVANAGDSRAVLCRKGGLTEPLSFDHKPLQKREMNRITRAGGFVNQFGRVNGNLNLSRSIGDLKYKQVPGIAPRDQMITAEPDIVSTTLRPGDEFIILGCDGIWDCLTNEECVKYVRDRIDTKPPSEIGAEMLDEIVSEDPRASQGIGGDNMTVMIVDLLPRSRRYHQ